MQPLRRVAEGLDHTPHNVDAGAHPVRSCIAVRVGAVHVPDPLQLVVEADVIRRVGSRHAGKGIVKEDIAIGDPKGLQRADHNFDIAAHEHAAFDEGTGNFIFHDVAHGTDERDNRFHASAQIQVRFEIDLALGIIEIGIGVRAQRRREACVRGEIALRRGRLDVNARRALNRSVIQKQGLITEAGYTEQAASYSLMQQAAGVAAQAENVAATGEQAAARGYLDTAQAYNEAGTGDFWSAAIKGVAGIAEIGLAPFTGGASLAVGAAAAAA